MVIINSYLNRECFSASRIEAFLGFSAFSLTQQQHEAAKDFGYYLRVSVVKCFILMKKKKSKMHV